MTWFHFLEDRDVWAYVVTILAPVLVYMIYAIKEVNK